MRLGKKFVQFGAVCGVLLGLSLLTTTAQAASTKNVTGTDGVKVEIPKKVKRVADLWHANNEVVLLLGGQDKLVATTPIIQKNAWFKTVYPEVTQVTAPFAGNAIQTETLLGLQPDVALTSDGIQAKALKDAGIPTVNVMFQDFAGLKKSVTLTASILGGKAPKVAKDYQQELQANIDYVTKKTKNQKEKPTILHIVNSTDLTKVDGTKTIVDDWIKAAGAKNSLDRQGNMISVTAEEITKANPDVIIMGSTTSAKALALLQKDARFAHLTAVKNKKVYGNPQGTFPWDRYSAEEALQVLWAAKLVHPEAFKKLDMVKKTQAFYAKYYGYELTKKQATQILASENPA
jgi:iron complex transport system substrate-binding protein